MKNEHNQINGKAIDTTNNIEESDVMQENGDTHSDTDTSPSKKSELKKKKKSKSKQKDKQLLKKEARMLREKAMSEGFEAFNFSSFALNDQQSETESLQNGDSQTEQTSLNSSQKRTLKHASDGGKSKKRKSTQIA